MSSLPPPEISTGVSVNILLQVRCSKDLKSTSAPETDGTGTVLPLALFYSWIFCDHSIRVGLHNENTQACFLAGVPAQMIKISRVRFFQSRSSSFWRLRVFVDGLCGLIDKNNQSQGEMGLNKLCISVRLPYESKDTGSPLEAIKKAPGQGVAKGTSML